MDLRSLHSHTATVTILDIASSKALCALEIQIPYAWSSIWVQDRDVATSWRRCRQLTHINKHYWPNSHQEKAHDKTRISLSNPPAITHKKQEPSWISLLGYPWQAGAREYIECFRSHWVLFHSVSSLPWTENPVWRRIFIIIIPVALHKAVAEVSKIGNL